MFLEMENISEKTVTFKNILTNLNFTFELPKYLTELLIYNGFDNYIALAMFEDEDYTKLEDFAKNDLVRLLDKQEIKDFFGLYSRNISLFKIVGGHRKLLDLIIKKCKTFSENACPDINKKRLSLGTTALNKKKKISHGIQDIPTVLENKNIDASNNDSITEHEIEHVRTVVTSYQKKFLDSLGDFEQKNDDLLALKHLNIQVKEDCVLINCPKCDFVLKGYSKIENKKKKWILSNVNRHFKTHYKNILLSKRTIQKQTDKKNSILSYLTKDVTPNSNIQTSIQTIEDLEPISVPSSLASSSIEISCDENATSSHHTSSTNLCDREIQYKEKNNIVFEQENSFELVEEFSENFSVGRITSEEAVETVSNSVQENNTPQIRNSNSYRITPTRSERVISKRQLLFDKSQLKLTDFYDSCEKIRHYISINPTINKQFELAMNIANDSCKESISKQTGPLTFFEMLKDAVIRNSKGKNKGGNRFSEHLKKLCLYIFLTSGRLAYKTLQLNMSRGLPCITTLNRTLTKFGKCTEGSLNLDDLRTFLEKRNYPLRVIISEDQTAVVKRVRYNVSTNQLVGCVPVISEKNGFPLEGQYKINTVLDIKNAIEKNNVSNNAYVYMAQPLIDGAPAFCISIFGSDNRFKAEDVIHRWQYILEEAQKRNIIIEGYSTDGDTRCLKAMKILAGIPSTLAENNPYSPYFQANFSIEKPIVFQDTVHISTKIKTRLLKPDIILPIGTYFVSKKHLEDLIKNIPKDKHFLNSSYLDGSDKMNFEAIDKLSAPCVTDLLSQNDDCKGTGRLLIITRAILDSFLDKSITVQHRIYLMWYATFFLRLWRGWLKFHKSYTLSKNWLTLNTYTCVEINAHALLLLIEKCRALEAPETFLPWLCSSQPCEKFFRQTRSMTSTYATMVNFDMLDLLQRQHRIQAINDIVSDTLGESEKSFLFPNENTIRLGAHITTDDNSLPSMEIIKNIIENAKIDAITDAKDLNMILPVDMEKSVLEQISIPLTKDTDHDIDMATEIAATDMPTEKNVINEEDALEDRDEIDIFSNFDSLNIKDYSRDDGKDGADCHSDLSMLNITVNNKNMLVKKSTLCWLFSDNKGKLSSDRRIRCRGMSAGMSLQNGSNSTKKSTQKIKIAAKMSFNKETTEETSDGRYSTSSELENESHSEEEIDALEPENKILCVEKYYATLYDTWYIGRIVEILDNNTYKMKFLKSELDDYVWPREEDIQIVERKFIFYGPLDLIGNGPFQLKRQDKLLIEKTYKNIKKK